MTRYTRAVHATPVGDVVLVHADGALLSLQVAVDGLPATRERMVRRLGLDPDDDPGPARDLTTQLDEYFAGTRERFDVTLDWSLVRGFTRAALEAVCEIPYGETAGYGEVAARAGSPRASRAVGTACATTPFSLVVPVHRVVRADGSIGEYGGHPEIKRFLLDLEQRPGA